MKILQLAGIFILAVSASAFAPSSFSQSKSVTVEIRNADGHNIGTAALSPAAHGVKIKLDIKALPPGQHSMHIHQFAKCDPPDFKTAGPHFGAAQAEHEHSPAGDIPDFSLIVADDGTAHVTVVAPNVTMGSEENSVFSNGGTAIVIHAVTDPSAPGAPARIACGVIAKH
jgi:Cu-Zn family superoxide dismutase